MRLAACSPGEEEPSDAERGWEERRPVSGPLAGSPLGRAGCLVRRRAAPRRHPEEAGALALASEPGRRGGPPLSSVPWGERLSAPLSGGPRAPATRQVTRLHTAEGDFLLAAVHSAYLLVFRRMPRFGASSVDSLLVLLSI